MKYTRKSSKQSLSQQLSYTRIASIHTTSLKPSGVLQSFVFIFMFCHKMLLLTDLFPLFSIVILWQYYNFVTLDCCLKGLCCIFLALSQYVDGSEMCNQAQKTMDFEKFLQLRQKNCRLGNIKKTSSIVLLVLTFVFKNCINQFIISKNKSFVLFQVDFVLFVKSLSLKYLKLQTKLPIYRFRYDSLILVNGSLDCFQ